MAIPADQSGHPRKVKEPTNRSTAMGADRVERAARGSMQGQGAAVGEGFDEYVLKHFFDGIRRN